METQRQDVFARQATGLIREFSAFHALVFNASFINVGLILIYMFLYVPSFHSGASMLVACIIGTVIAVPMALANAMLAVTYPRSGGEYVYNSRVLRPCIGFATNFNITIWLLFYIGVSCALFPKYGLSALCRYFGANWGSDGFIRAGMWFTTPSGIFVVGTIVLFVVVCLWVVGSRRVARIQSWYFLFGCAGVTLAVVILLCTGGEQYTQRLNSYFVRLGGEAGSLAAQTAEAKEYGYATAPFSHITTLLILFWPASFLFWGNASTYFGGEVRNAKYSQLIGLTGAIILAGLLITCTVAAFKKTVGAETLGVINYLHLCGGGPGFSPTYAEFAAVATSSRLIGLIILAACTYWTIAFVPLCMGACTRNFLAWSLDRLAPQVLSQVSPRFHSPVPALIFCGVVGEIFVFLHAFVPAFAFMVGVVGAFLTFIATAISATVLPFRRAQTFENSPVNWRWRGFPVITIVGVLAILGLLAVEISVLSDPYSGISLLPSTDAGYGAGIPFRMLLVNLAILAAGFVVYYVAKLIRKSQGIDVTFAFKQIPPE